MAFLARNPFLRLVIPMMAGILLQDHFHFGWHLLWITAVGSMILLAGYGFLPLKRRFFMDWMQGAFITLTFIALGSILLKVKQHNLPELPGDKLTFTARVLDIPEKKNKTWQTVIETGQVFSNGPVYHEKTKLLTYIEKTTDTLPVKPGERIIATGYPHRIQNAGNPGEFDYRRYMAVQNISHQIYLGKEAWNKSLYDPKPSITSLSNRIRLHLLKQLKKSDIAGDEYAIASALLLGYKDFLTPDMRTQFSASGAMHILAVSGLHVGLLYLIFHYLLFFLEKFKYGKITKTLIIIILLVGYAFLTGLSPSVCRATLMFSVIAFGQVLRRYSSIYNSLAFSAFVLLAINPLLLFSISFQLSYMAVLSIVFFQPRLYRLIELPLVPDKLWQWLTVALAAQIGTFPIVIHTFNLFPNYFWLTNFIAIPAAALIILFGFLYFLTVPFVPLIGQAMAAVLSYVLSALNFSTGFIQNLPLAITNNLWISETQVWLFYLLIAFLSGWLILKKSMYLQVTLVLLTALVLSDIGLWYKRYHQKEFLVYNIRNESVYNYIDAKHNFLFHNTSEDKIRKEVTYSIQDFWLSRGAETFLSCNISSIQKRKAERIGLQSNFIGFNGLRIGFISNENEWDRLVPNHKLKLDYLILASDVKTTLGKLNTLFDFKMIILDSSNSYYYRRKMAGELKKQGTRVHSVVEDGAFRVTFD